MTFKELVLLETSKIDTFNKKYNIKKEKTEDLPKWKQNELKVIELLKNHKRYKISNNNNNNNSLNSSKPDVKIFDSTGNSFNIEIKSLSAQTSQFIIPQTEQQIKLVNFYNEYLKKSNEEKKRSLNYLKKLCVDCIIKDYEIKNIKEIALIKNDKLVLIPREKFGNFFDIDFIYRNKKSGSHEIKSEKLLNYARELYKNNLNKVKTTKGEIIKDVNGDEYLFKDGINGRINKLGKTNNKTYIFKIKYNPPSPNFTTQQELNF